MPEVGRYERQETEGRKSGKEKGEGEKREEEWRRGRERGDMNIGSGRGNQGFTAGKN